MSLSRIHVVAAGSAILSPEPILKAIGDPKSFVLVGASHDRDPVLRNDLGDSDGLILGELNLQLRGRAYRIESKFERGVDQVRVKFVGGDASVHFERHSRLLAQIGNQYSNVDLVEFQPP